MSWDIKYRCEFTDILALDWKIDFEDETAHSGDPVSMQGTGTPLKFNFLSNSQAVFEDPIHGSTVDINIYSDTHFQWAGFYAYEEQKWRISIYYGSTLYWCGFINSKGYNEPYDGVSYPVIISASDCLGYLKEIPFSDTALSGHKAESQIILDILSKIRYTGFREFVNIYEESMSTTVNDSPFDQTSVDTDIFKDSKCYDVLVEILKKYNACIRTVGGNVVIYRPIELSQATIYGRIFTSGIPKTSTTISTEQFVSRSTVVTDLRDVEGGNQGVQDPAKKVTINQDYGNKDSWLDNWKFEGNKFSGSAMAGFTAESWVNNGDTYLIVPINKGLASEADGVVLNGKNNYPTVSKYISQQFALYALNCSNILCFEFNYQWINEKGSAVYSNDFYFSVESVSGTHYLQITDGSYCTWVGSLNIMAISEDVPDGNSGWQTWSRKFTTLPVPGEYIVKFYGLDDGELNVFMAVKDVKFFSTSDTITVKKTKSYQWPFGWLTRWKKSFEYIDKAEIVQKVYNPTCTPTKGIELNYDYLLGDVTDAAIDNVIEQFAGALATVARDSLTDTATDFVTNHSGDYPGITVSHSTNHVSLTENDGNDFTGPTSITNTSGDLSGTVVTSPPHSVSRPQIDQVLIVTGTAVSSIDITIGALTRRCSWDTDPATTVTGFVTAGNIALFAAIGITLDFNDTVPADGFTFTSAPGTANAFTTSIVQVNPTLTYVLTTDQTAADTVARVDTITLAGTYGTANILCDGVTKEIDVDEVLTYSTDWNTRGGSESKPILEIIGDEIADQYSRAKQLVTLPILENSLTSNLPQINILGNFKDDLNKYGANNRVFIFNSGEFEVRDRSWSLDLIEII
jgi:hypothetical protein